MSHGLYDYTDPFLRAVPPTTPKQAPVRKCSYCLGDADNEHDACLRCAETHSQRPFERYQLDAQGHRCDFVQGITPNGDGSVDLASVNIIDQAHPLLEATRAEVQDIFNRMHLGLNLTVKELDTVLTATAKADPALAKRMRKILATR